MELHSGGLFGGDTIGTVQACSLFVQRSLPMYKCSPACCCSPADATDATLMRAAATGPCRCRPSSPQVPLDELMQRRRIHEQFSLAGADGGRVELELEWKPYFG